MLISDEKEQALAVLMLATKLFFSDNMHSCIHEYLGDPVDRLPSNQDEQQDGEEGASDCLVLEVPFVGQGDVSPEDVKL